MTNSLALPIDSHKDIYESCISNLHATTKKKFLDNLDYFIDKGDEFESKMIGNTLFNTTPVSSVGTITTHEMVYLYTGKLSKLGHPARVFYDRLRSIPANGQCPLCSVRTVTTLDHYLPKADFPVYAILPINLIPACRDCNTDKLSETPTTHSEETIHPYFDVLPDGIYLHANLIKTKPASLVFFVNAPSPWGSVLQSRLKTHFRIFNLNKLYVVTLPFFEPVC
nr:hypothetical protein [Pedobacter sp. ASV19]